VFSWQGIANFQGEEDVDSYFAAPLRVIFASPIEFLAVHRTQCLLLLAVVSGYLISGMLAESAMMSDHESFDNPVVYFALTLQHRQDLGVEDLFQFLLVVKVVLSICQGEAGPPFQLHRDPV
jgi:hypothetical protein